MANFADILSKQSSEVERPKPYPVGSYVALLKGLPEQTELGERKTPCLEFNVELMQPMQDVDPQALAECGFAPGKRIRLRQFVTDESLWRLKQFLTEHLGIEEGSKTIGQMISETPGRQFIATIGHRPSQDGTQIYSEIRQTAHV